MPIGQQANGQASGSLFNFQSPAPKALPPLSSSLRSTPIAGRQTPKLRGLSANPSSSSPSLNFNPSSSSYSSSSGNGLNSSLFLPPSSSSINLNAFTPRSGVKKLVLDKKITGADLAASTLSAGRGLNMDRSRLNPDAEVESTLGGSVVGLEDDINQTPAPRREGSVLSTSRVNANTFTPSKTVSTAFSIDDVEEGEYYTIPSVETLGTLGHDQLASLKGFVVGRKGWGKVAFQKPVDLTTVTHLQDIKGKLVLFETKLVCEVYPEGSDRQEPGRGMNQPAIITLEDCFVRDPATGSNLTDPNHPKVKQRRRKMENMKDTKFISFDPAAGIFEFSVEHFTKYGFMDDEDEDEDMSEDDGFAAASTTPVGTPANKGGYKKRPLEDGPPKTSLWEPAGVDDIAEEDEEGLEYQTTSESDDGDFQPGDDDSFDGPRKGLRDGSGSSMDDTDDQDPRDGMDDEEDVGDGPTPLPVARLGQQSVEYVRSSLFGPGRDLEGTPKANQSRLPFGKSYFGNAEEEFNGKFDKSVLVEVSVYLKLILDTPYLTGLLPTQIAFLLRRLSLSLR